MADTPNCYDCIHQGEVLGSAHSVCHHPEAGAKDGNAALAILASVGRGGPAINASGAKALNIEAHPHGIRMGWFNWPYEFDPTWLRGCDGFTAKPKSAEAAA